MATVTVTKLYDSLASQIGKESAENLTNFIEQKISIELENKIQLLATKEDLSKVELKLVSSIGQLDIKIGEVKAEMIKWMFLFWIGQLIATFGFILLFLKK